MTKKELIEALTSFPDDTEIVIWKWTSGGADEHTFQPVLNNQPSEAVFRVKADPWHFYTEH